MAGRDRELIKSKSSYAQQYAPPSVLVDEELEIMRSIHPHFRETLFCFTYARLPRITPSSTRHHRARDMRRRGDVWLLAQISAVSAENAAALLQGMLAELGEAKPSTESK